MSYAIITKSRSKKKPFKVTLIGKNGETLMTPQLLTTRLNVKKNLLATMAVFNGSKVKVYDKTYEKKYSLWADGYEDEVLDWEKAKKQLRKAGKL